MLVLLTIAADLLIVIPDSGKIFEKGIDRNSCYSADLCKHRVLKQLLRNELLMKFSINLDRSPTP